MKDNSIFKALLLLGAIFSINSDLFSVKNQAKGRGSPAGAMGVGPSSIQGNFRKGPGLGSRVAARETDEVGQGAWNPHAAYFGQKREPSAAAEAGQPVQEQFCQCVEPVTDFFWSISDLPDGYCQECGKLISKASSDEESEEESEGADEGEKILCLNCSNPAGSGLPMQFCMACWGNLNEPSPWDFENRESNFAPTDFQVATLLSRCPEQASQAQASTGGGDGIDLSFFVGQDGQVVNPSTAPDALDSAVAYAGSSADDAQWTALVNQNFGAFNR